MICPTCLRRAISRRVAQGAIADMILRLQERVREDES